MKVTTARFAAVLAFTLLALGLRGWPQAPTAIANSEAAQQVPAWAYIAPASGRGRGAGPRSTNPADVARHVPGSAQEYPQSFISSLFNVPDWFPESHPPMPDVVAHGRPPSVWACGFCHLPNGVARPENESIAGLPVQYMIQQIHDFKSGARKSSDPNLLSVQHMRNVALAVSEEDINAAAQYYSAIKPTPAMRVVETDMVPKTKPTGFMLQATDDGEEPIAGRIIELPEDRDLTELRDDKSGFVVYVPKGSVKKGEELVASGDNGKSLPCVTCHGSDLRGIGNVPSIAGRSPSQMVRQIIDFQTGARHGQGAQMMKPVVTNLKLDDIVNITAYLTSLKP